MDEISLFPCNIEANEVPSTIISSASFSKLNIFNKMWFQEVYVVKMKIFNFVKTPFLVLNSHLLMIIQWILMISKKFEVMDFAGLFWPSLAFLAFVALDKKFKQKLAFFGKN